MPLNTLRILVATLVALALFVLVVTSVVAGGMRVPIAVLVSAVLATLATVWVARTRGPAGPLPTTSERTGTPWNGKAASSRIDGEWDASIVC